jgi:hypothetical protein
MLVDLNERRIVERRLIDYNSAPDFPAHRTDLTGYPYDSMWMLGIGAAGRPGRKFFDQMVRVDWNAEKVDVWQAPRATYLGGEPVFVPELDPSGPAPSSARHSTPKPAPVIHRLRRVQPGAGADRGREASSPIPLLFHSSYLPR